MATCRSTGLKFHLTRVQMNVAHRSQMPLQIAVLTRIKTGCTPCVDGMRTTTKRSTRGRTSISRTHVTQVMQEAREDLCTEEPWFSYEEIAPPMFPPRANNHEPGESHCQDFTHAETVKN